MNGSLKCFPISTAWIFDHSAAVQNTFHSAVPKRFRCVVELLIGIHSIDHDPGLIAFERFGDYAVGLDEYALPRLIIARRIVGADPEIVGGRVSL